MLADSLQNLVFNPPTITLEADSDGGGTFAWTKRFGMDTLRGFAQRIRRDGTFIYPLEGLRTSLFDSSTNGAFKIVTSLGDSKIFVMGDKRFGASVFAQRIDSTGLRDWEQDDNIISRRQLGSRDAISDGVGGLILVGFDQSDFSVRMQQCSRNGLLAEVISTAVSACSDMNLPGSSTLDQNYPNPFNPSTSITYSIPTQSHVTVTIYDLLGREVKRLVGEVKQPGEYSVTWDASDVPSGVYFYRLVAGQCVQTEKMVLMR